MFKNWPFVELLKVDGTYVTLRKKNIQRIDKEEVYIIHYGKGKDLQYFCIYRNDKNIKELVEGKQE